MPTALLSNVTLAEFYRFALLLTGRSDAAATVMTETLAEVESQLDQFRTETNRQAWLATRIRQRCLKNNAQNSAPAIPRLLRESRGPGAPPEVLRIEAYILAEHFHCLLEPGRSALALFYLELFTPQEIAHLLEMKLAELGATLSAARECLQHSLAAKTP